LSLTMQLPSSSGITKLVRRQQPKKTR